MFAKDLHTAICGNMEKMNEIASHVSAICSEIGEMSLLPSPAISKLRTLQADLKAIKQYSLTIHGLNLALHRMPSKQQPRERAALLREQRGENFLRTLFKEQWTVFFSVYPR